MPNEQKLKTRFCQGHKMNLWDARLNLKYWFKITYYHNIIINIQQSFLSMVNLNALASALLPTGDATRILSTSISGGASHTFFFSPLFLNPVLCVVQNFGVFLRKTWGGSLTFCFLLHPHKIRRILIWDFYLQDAWPN